MHQKIPKEKKEKHHYPLGSSPPLRREPTAPLVEFPRRRRRLGNLSSPSRLPGKASAAPLAELPSRRRRHPGKSAVAPRFPVGWPAAGPSRRAAARARPWGQSLRELPRPDSIESEKVKRKGEGERKVRGRRIRITWGCGPPRCPSRWRSESTASSDVTRATGKPALGAYSAVPGREACHHNPARHDTIRRLVVPCRATPPI